MKKRIIFEQTNGEPSIKVEGVKGSGCLKETADLEKALGTVKSVEKTREYNQKDTHKKKDMA